MLCATAETQFKMGTYPVTVSSTGANYDLRKKIDTSVPHFGQEPQS